MSSPTTPDVSLQSTATRISTLKRLRNTLRRRKTTKDASIPHHLSASSSITIASHTVPSITNGKTRTTTQTSHISTTTLSTLALLKSLLTRIRRSKQRRPLVTTVTRVPTGHRNSILQTAVSAGSAESLGPYEFLASADVNLFATGVKGKYYRLEGEGLKELVLVEGGVRLGELFDGIGGVGDGLGGLRLGGVKLAYQTTKTGSETGEQQGVWITASTDFKGVLADVGGYFGIEDVVLDIRGFVGDVENWKQPLVPEKLVLRGTVTGKKRGFTKVVVEVHITGKEVRLELSGDVVMPLPGGAVKMGWNMREEEKGTWTLTIEDQEVGDVVGFKGLKLIDLSFVANFPIGSLGDTNFQVQAGLQFGSGMLQLRGVFDKEFYLETEITSCTPEDIQGLYTSTTGRELAPFNHLIEFNSLIFRVDQTGLIFSGGITIDGHHSVSASISIKRDGILITGSISSIPLGSTGISVENSAMNIFLGRTSGNETSRSSGFSITGLISFKKLSLNVAVHTLLQDGKVTTVAYGEIEGHDLGLSLLEPRVKGTWLDLELKQMAFIYSDIDSPAFGDYNVFGYPIHRGVQFCATIDRRIESLDSATQQEIHGLLLHARYDIPANTVTLGLMLPSPVGIHISKRVTSGPISIEVLIPIHDTPQLRITSALNVQPPRQTEPLVFTFGINCDFDSIEAFGQMENYWLNPLGISDRVKVGPHLALQVGYTHFSAGMAPPTVGFAGGIKIGDTSWQVAVNISENPADELISVSLSELFLSDLISFAADLSHHSETIPVPEEDVFALRDISFYLSAGTTVGTKYYPPGASFKGQLSLFGQTTALDATVGSTTRIAAEFEALSLGPLSLRGTDDDKNKNATAVIELGTSKQHILLDGCVLILGFQASLHGSFDILPIPKIEFEIVIAFGDLLKITLAAKLMGPQHFGSLEGADFILHAVVEQHVIEYLLRQIRYCFTALEHFIVGGLEAVQNFISDAKEGIEAAIAAATEAFQEAERRWKDKEAAIAAALKEAEEEFRAHIADLEDDLFATRTTVESAILEARKTLEAQQLLRAATLSAAHSQVLRKKAELEKDIGEKLQSIREVKEKTQRTYGAVEGKIKAAEEELRKKQREFYATNAAYVKALEGTHFFSGLPAHLALHRLKHLRNDAVAELVTARTVLQQLQKVAARGEWARLKKEKQRQKNALAVARRLRDREMEVMEAREKRSIRDVEMGVEYHEFLAQQAEERRAEVEMKLRAVQEYREFKTPVVEGKRDVWMRVEDEREFKVKEERERELREKRGLKIEAEAVERVVGKFRGLRDKKDMEEVQRKKFDIEKIELTGSLRALVEKGKPLEAKITVVVNGERREVVVNWGFGDVVGLVETAVGVIWGVMTEKV